MPKSNKRLLIRTFLMGLVMLLGIAMVAVFGLRTWSQWQYAQRVASGEIHVESLRGWMTLPYIAHTYEVPEADIRSALGLPGQGNNDRSLREWFEAEAIDPHEGRRMIEMLLVARARSTSEASR